MQQGDVGQVAANFAGVVMSVVESVDREVRALGPQAEGSTMAETALALACELDGENSATSKSLCAKALVDVMRELRLLAPAEKETDAVDDLTAQRKKRIADRARRSAPARSARP